MVLMESPNHGPYYLERGSDELRDDAEVVKYAVEHIGDTLQYASLRLMDDESVVRAAVTRDGLSLQYASPRLKNDQEIVLLAISRSWEAFSYASDELKNNYEVAIAAVTKDGEAYELLSDALKSNVAVVCRAMEHTFKIAEVLYCAPDEIKGNRQVAMTAIRQCAGIGEMEFMHQLSDELASDPDIVLAVLEASQIPSHSARKLLLRPLNRMGEHLIRLEELHRSYGDHLFDPIARYKKYRTVEGYYSKRRVLENNTDTVDYREWHRKRWEHIWLVGQVILCMKGLRGLEEGEDEYSNPPDCIRSIIEFSGLDQPLRLHNRALIPIVNKFIELDMALELWQDDTPWILHGEMVTIEDVESRNQPDLEPRVRLVPFRGAVTNNFDRINDDDLFPGIYSDDEVAERMIAELSIEELSIDG